MEKGEQSTVAKDNILVICFEMKSRGARDSGTFQIKAYLGTFHIFQFFFSLVFYENQVFFYKPI